MTPTATATAGDDAGSVGAVPLGFHLAAAAWVSGMLTFAAADSYRYELLLQEDRFVEWWTVGLFAAAAALRFRSALPSRRIFDLLVALFCLFVAGEEFSWGQRLFGFTPPSPFLEHNTQQELTVHNFADVFGKPRGVLILALLGFGLALPVTAASQAGRRLASWIGATPPPSASVPWFVLAAGVLWWYPVDFTGEWVETLAGALFLTTAAPRPSILWSGGVLTACFAAVLTVVSGAGAGEHPREVACATSEVNALLADLVSGDAAAPRLLRRRGSVHKRLWTAARDGYVRPGSLPAFSGTTCSRTNPGGAAKRYLVDPWGMAYWIRADRVRNGERRLVVYSMGPNRRRDVKPGQPGGDDIAAVGRLRSPVPE